jgi:hypothetical protein
LLRLNLHQMTQNLKTTNTHNIIAYENLLNLIKEFELAYNLSPELSQKQKDDLIKKIAQIFSPEN